MSPKTKNARPSVPRIVPGRSAPDRSTRSRVSGTSARTPITTMTAMGMLIRNAQCQDAYVVSQPPTSGPKAAMPPIVAPHTAKATARSRPRYTALRTDKDAGRIMAAPIPCNARAPMSSTAPSDIATRPLETANTTTPETNISRRPTMSANRPESSSNEANVSA